MPKVPRLEAQRRSVQDYVDGPILKEFLEVETGTEKRSRPELEKALSEARLHNAVLVVAKVDRLTRSVGFLHTLLGSGAEVEFCDLPQISGPTGKFMLNQMAAVAELEAGMISQRTKAALASAKARGVKLGNPQNLTLEGRLRGTKRSAEIQHQKAKNDALDRLPHIQALQEEGLSGLSEIARGLNERGIPTPRGGQWQAVQVKRVLELV